MIKLGKDEKIFVHQGATHNKFWTSICDEATFEVTIRWGRLGTKGQSKKYPFATRRDATYFMLEKNRERLRKGYTGRHLGKEISRAMLDQLGTEAAIVGSQNKCHTFKWVELVGFAAEISYKEIDEDRLYNPECNPGILVNFETRKEIDGRKKFVLLFTLESAYDLRGHNPATPERLIESGHPLRKMVDKVEEAIGRSLQA